MADSISQTFGHGSPHSWDAVFDGLDLTYTEEPESQGKLFEMVKIHFMESILPKPPQKMIEIGCGTAFVSLYFAKRGYQATCMDINESILAVAERNFANENITGTFVAGDAEKLDLPSDSYDIVTSFGLLEHFENPNKAISEMVRIIKPGGMFFADIVPARFSCQTFGNVFNALASASFWAFKGKPAKGIEHAMHNFKPLYYENHFSWHQYEAMMVGAGLENIHITGNRPFPRLTLSAPLDRLYAQILKPSLPLWRMFDKSESTLSKLWGAGWWFWGIKK